MDRDNEVGHKFRNEIVKAQKALEKGRGGELKEIFKKKKELVDEAFDAKGSTVLHVVAREGQHEMLRELMKMQTDEKKKELMMRENDKGNTILHEVAGAQLDKRVTKRTLEVVEEQTTKDWVSLIPTLLKILNKQNETPVFRAAKYGNLTMLKYFHENDYKFDISEHFPPSQPLAGTSVRRPILHSCSLLLKFETAVWLMENVERLDYLATQTSNEKISDKEEYEELTCIQQLSRMPFAFKGTQPMGTRKKFIYYMLPIQGYVASNNSSIDKLEKRILEIQYFGTAQDFPGQLLLLKGMRLLHVFWSFMYYAFWKLVARGLYWTRIDEIWDQKKTHKFAERLAKMLIERDDSWRFCDSKSSGLLVVSPKFPSNVTETKKQLELKDRIKIKIELKDQLKKEKKKNEDKWEFDIEEGTSSSKKEDENKNSVTKSPLLAAAAFGIIEMVKMMVDMYPEAMSHVGEDGCNILHIAVKHRQLEIYHFIKKKPAIFKSLLHHISGKDGRSVLHQAATMEYYREQQLPGVAYQLQHELQWYHRVSSHVPSHYVMHVDKEGLIARERLEIEHAEMHDQAKQWMKETAQSCSTVAVLIAGVVFAAAYAIPGGFDKGRATLLKKSTFRIFTIMDIVALSCSLGSVVMFLAILTSSFDLWEFRKSLPQKLKFGFILLFFALITTMLAFAATILLTIRLEDNKKTTIFAYSLAFVIVSVFGLTQFPLKRMLVPLITLFWKYGKKIMRVSPPKRHL